MVFETYQIKNWRYTMRISFSFATKQVQGTNSIVKPGPQDIKESNGAPDQRFRRPTFGFDIITPILLYLVPQPLATHPWNRQVTSCQGYELWMHIYKGHLKLNTTRKRYSTPIFLSLQLFLQPLLCYISCTPYNSPKVFRRRVLTCNLHLQILHRCVTRSLRNYYSMHFLQARSILPLYIQVHRQQTEKMSIKQSSW